MISETANSNELWLAFLEKEYFWCEKGTVEHDIAATIKDMLLSPDDDNAAHTAAHQLNTYYWERNNESGEFFKWENEKDPYFDFLSCLYDIMITMTLYVPYNDARQDALVQLALELRNLPPNPVKAWNGDRLVDSEDETFAEILDDTWGGNFASSSEGFSPSEWKEHCEKWVNFSSFLARCCQARIDDHLPGLSKYPNINIADGLGGHIPPGVERDSWVMVAAQYVLLAGPFLDEEFIQRPGAYETGVVKWKFWASRFEELEEWELAQEVKEAVIEARKKLISLRPELFYVSEGGTEPDDEQFLSESKEERWRRRTPARKVDPYDIHIR